MGRPVVIDTDPGVDDALALLLAAASPEIEVLAITTVAGNVGLERATGNARRAAAVAWHGRAAPPIFRGAAGGDETAEEVHGADGLGGAASLYPPAAPLEGEDAVSALVRMARGRPGEIALVTLGPLTNLAAALRRDPGLPLGEVIVMGGAFREPGNASPVAEFNIHVDPEAARAVCESGLATTWVPLDVTHRCLLRGEDLESLGSGERLQFARRITRFYMEYHFQGHGVQACYLHDPLAVGALLWPELLRAEPVRVEVETEGRCTRGMTVGDLRPAAYRSPAPPNARVCLDVDAGEFGARFLERLAARP